MSGNGITLEEFEVFQQNLNEMSRESFVLRERLAELTKQTTDYQSKKDKITELETHREELRKRHTESLQLYKDELAKLQKQAAEQHEENSKKMNARIAELNEKLAAVSKQVKEKEDSNEKLRGNIRIYDNRLNQVNHDLEEIKRKEAKFQPIVQFLQRTRSVPMYIEDLAMHNHRFLETYNKNMVDISDVKSKIKDLELRDKELSNQLIAKNMDVQTAKNRLKMASESLEEAKRETAKTQSALDEAKKKYQNAKLMTEKAINDRNESTVKFESDKKYLLEELSTLRKANEENRLKISEIQGMSTKEISNFDDKIKETRRKITIIRDTGIDPDNASVDHDLDSQIVSVIQEKKNLENHMKKMDGDIETIEAEIEAKEAELQTLTLKMKPTPKITAAPEFQATQLLLEELVVQNRTLRETFTKMANRIVDLKKENEDIKKNFRKQMVSE